jgi:hypothetical protein
VEFFVAAPTRVLIKSRLVFDAMQLGIAADKAVFAEAWVKES